MNKKVIFNTPNSVGLCRIILLFACIFFENTCFLLIYFISISLDLIDGSIARYLNSVTKLGACLDMFTDLCSTIVIQCKIGERKPSNFLIFSLVIDLASHMMLFSGANADKISHKKTSFVLLKVYYHTVVLVILCAGTNLYHIVRYMETYKAIDERVVGYLFYLYALRYFFNILRFFEGLVRLGRKNDNFD